MTMHITLISNTNVTTALFFSITFLLTYLFVRLQRGKKRKIFNTPPCLPSLPFFGSVLFLGKFEEFHIFCMKKAEQLGPVFAVYLGNRYTVCINGKPCIQEALIKQSLSYADRPYFNTIRSFNADCKGILDHPYNSDFRRYHSLSLNILKKFGFGQGIMETRIQVEVDDLLYQMKKMNGEVFCPDELITGSVANVIMSIILGNRYEHSDPKLYEIINNVHKFIQTTQDLSEIDSFPPLRYHPKYRKSLQHSTMVHEKLIQFLKEKIDGTLNGEISESFISHFIDEEGPEFDRSQLLFTLRDLLLAGTETSSTTLLWALVLLANHQDIQQRLHKEIDSVVSSSKLPSLDDRKSLPFVQATILELMRRKTIVPLSLPHSTVQDSVINGSFIPKGTLIFINLYSAHMDRKVWHEPDVFRPERFLDADGNVINRDAVISFSMGRRSCLGELLANQEIFLFLTGLLQRFNILPPEGYDTVECHEVVTVTMAPSPFKVRLIPRIQKE